jgi:hypothetical protein
VYVSILRLDRSLSHPSNRESEGLAPNRTFLSYLFDLIAFLCECGGDFMVDRIKSSVFPVMLTWFQHFGPQQTKSSPQQTIHCFARGVELLDEDTSSVTLFPTTSDSLKLGDSERQLLLSIVRCLTRILRQRDCGRALLSVLPKAGLMLLPFVQVADDDELQACVMDCLKCILHLDCVALRRALLDLSGCSILPCPLQSRIDRNGSKMEMMLSARLITLATKCRDLLLYAENLPEQTLV